MQRSSVDLPVPDGPMMAMRSPLAMSRSMPASTVAAPKRLIRPSMRIIGRRPG